MRLNNSSPGGIGIVKLLTGTKILMILLFKNDIYYILEKILKNIFATVGFTIF